VQWEFDCFTNSKEDKENIIVSKNMDINNPEEVLEML
jgi:hypothetical protein